MEKFCNNCGKKFNAKAQFCDECGVALKEVIKHDDSDVPAGTKQGKPKKNALLRAVVVVLVVALCGYMWYNQEEKVIARNLEKNIKQTNDIMCDVKEYSAREIMLCASIYEPELAKRVAERMKDASKAYTYLTDGEKEVLYKRAAKIKKISDGLAVTDVKLLGKNNAMANIKDQKGNLLKTVSLVKMQDIWYLTDYLDFYRISDDV